ncbi:hypothetical protein CEXT_692281 [Caerostris extrusa]|uniref:Ycf15 n=1 Tax=Caerostris extrusa TaxID=172846 RepID=A0AAV4W562_CAEEX|nr:hypothetical protein CEXT_692281 [Caerostris extrusa]
MLPATLPTFPGEKQRISNANMQSPNCYFRESVAITLPPTPPTPFILCEKPVPLTKSFECRRILIAKHFWVRNVSPKGEVRQNSAQ